MKNLICAASVLAVSTAQGDVLFVDDIALPGGDGASWATAYNDLQEALFHSFSGDELWIAAGTYKPAGLGGSRLDTFLLQSGVAMYGGFVGSETQREARDPGKNLTILSGDLNEDDDPDFQNTDDNSYHVVTATSVISTTVLDGFVIKSGNGNGAGDRRWGAGLIIVGGNPSVTNCLFTQNLVSGSNCAGAGIYMQGSGARIEQCVFLGNAVNGGGGPETEGGGGIAVLSGGNPEILDCSFLGNFEITAGRGAGILIFASSPSLVSYCQMLWMVA